MKMRRLLFAGIAFLLSAVFVEAQPAQRRPLFGVVIGGVSDYRDNSDRSSIRGCTVNLKFSGDAISQALDFIKLHPTKAVDDLGENLLSKDTDNMFITSETYTAKNTIGLSANVYLRSPARNAKTIRLLEGEVEFFIPTFANGSLAIINDFANYPEVSIPNATLQKLGVEVISQSKERFEARKRYRAAANTNLLEKNWLDPNVMARLFVKKTTNLPVRAELRSKDGNVLINNVRFFGDGMRYFDLTNQPPPGTQLVVAELTPQSKQTFRFKLENIALP